MIDSKYDNFPEESRQYITELTKYFPSLQSKWYAIMMMPLDYALEAEIGKVATDNCLCCTTFYLRYQVFNNELNSKSHCLTLFGNGDTLPIIAVADEDTLEKSANKIKSDWETRMLLINSVFI